MRLLKNIQKNKESIKKAFGVLYSKDFQESLKIIVNPYGDGYASQKIIEEIKKVDLQNILKKSFYDLSFSYENL